MNIGDKVRFLSDVGGGIVCGFQKGNIVLVEDEDGFQIPAPMDEVVVIDTNEYNFAKHDKKAGASSASAPKSDGKQASASNASQQGKPMMTGSDYLASKGIASGEEEEVDETLEARVIRLEMQIRKLEMRLARLEDSKAAREKEKIQARQQRQQQKNEILEVDLHSSEILETEAGMSAGDIKQYQLKVFNDTMQEHLGERGKRIVFIHGKGDGVLRKAIIDELKYKYKQCEYQDASFQQYGFGATMVIIH